MLLLSHFNYTLFWESKVQKGAGNFVLKLKVNAEP